jgi:protein-L-isoaspartate(D-aspartate) O-methyltransferase
MAYIDFISPIHTRTPRNYLDRVIGVDKAACAEIAGQFGRDYWDGERKYGYGGYQYDGRWQALARSLAEHYDLQPGAKILDVGCGKGYLLHDFAKIIPGVEVAGIDISEYAIENSHPGVREHLQLGNATDLPWLDSTFDLVLSINTLHNLRNYDLERSLKEIQRVGRGAKYVVVDSYRTEREKVNLMYWQLTCVCFYTPEEWEWMFQKSGYTGDFACIFYE